MRSITIVDGEIRCDELCEVARVDWQYSDGRFYWDGDDFPGSPPINYTPNNYYYGRISGSIMDIVRMLEVFGIAKLV